MRDKLPYTLITLSWSAIALILVVIIARLATIVVGEYNSSLGHARAVLLAVFSIGYIFQFITLVIQNNNIKPKDLRNALITSLASSLIFLIALLGGYKDVQDLYFSSFLALIMAGWTFCIFLKEYFSPKIDEQTLAIACLLLGYLFIQHDVSFIVLLIYAPCAILALVNIYTNIDIYLPIRVILYTFFLIIIISISVIHLRVSDMNFFFSNSNSDIPIINVLASGMLLGYITPYITYLLRLWPIPGKHESWKERKNELKITINDFMRYFNPNENFPLRNTLVVAIVVLLLYSNYKFELVSDSYVITIALILVKVANMFKNTQTIATQVES